MFQQQNQSYASSYVPGSRKRQSNQDPLKYTIVDEDPELRGQYNFETGTIETGQWRGLKSASLHGIQDLLYRISSAYKHIRRIENS